MSQIRETTFIIVGALFAILGIWGISSPVSEDIVLQLLTILFTVLGSIGVGIGGRGKYIAAKLASRKVVFANGLRIEKKG